MGCRHLCCTTLVLFFFLFHLQATDYPTSGANTIDVFTSPVTLYAGDTVGTNNGGLTWFRSGIRIDAYGGFVEMATPLRIEEYIDGDYGVAGGIILLKNNLILGYQSFGLTDVYIDFNGYSLKLFDSVKLLGTTLTVTHISGSTRIGAIEGVGGTLDFGSSGKIFIESPGYDYDFYLRNLKLINVSGSPIDSNGTNVDLFLENVVLQMEDDVYLGGDLDFVYIIGDVFITGPGHTFCVDTEFKIGPSSRIIFDIGTTFSAGLHCDFDVGSNATIYFDGCNIEMGDNIGVSGDENHGILIPTGNVIFDNKVTINDDGNHKAFQVTGGTVTILPGAQVLLEGTTTFSVI